MYSGKFLRTIKFKFLVFFILLATVLLLEPYCCIAIKLCNDSSRSLETSTTSINDR